MVGNNVGEVHIALQHITVILIKGHKSLFVMVYEKKIGSGRLFLVVVFEILHRYVKRCAEIRRLHRRCIFKYDHF